MITLGRQNNLVVASHLDDDGDALMATGNKSDWISKEDAEKLIAHLQKVFEL